MELSSAKSWLNLAAYRPAGVINAAEAITGKGTISITTSTDNGHVQIDISDTGRGLSAEMMENILDVGFSEKDSPMRMHTGLAGCYAIVQKHHGEINVESEIGRGSVFRTRLPIKMNLK